MCNHAQLLTCQSFSVLPPIPNNLIPRLQAIHFQAMCVEVKVTNNRRLHTVCNQAIHFLLVISTLHDQHHRHDNQSFNPLYTYIWYKDVHVQTVFTYVDFLKLWNIFLNPIQILWACRSEVCGIPSASPAWRLRSLVTQQLQ